MKNIFFVFLAFTSLFIACEASLNKPADTFIRIRNMISQRMDEVISNDTRFGTVDSLSVSGYHSFAAQVLPTAIVITGGDTAYAGALSMDGTQAYIQGGKHTLQLYRQSSTDKRYTLLVTED